MRQIDAVQLGQVSFNPDTGDGGLVRKSYKMELLTPLLGGDTETWVPNVERPIRVPAIKGQLRFWWRTMQGVLSPTDLLELEGQFWGKTGKSSPISLKVSYEGTPTFSTIKKMDRDGNPNVNGVLQCTSYPKYVLFPLQNQRNRCELEIVDTCFFTLDVICKSELLSDVEKILKLWILFGGVGGRTRRGAGSLFCPELTKGLNTPELIAVFVRSCCEGQVQAFGTSKWPRLAGSRLAFAVAGEKEGWSAWKDFLEAYGDFRQKAGVGRAPVDPATRRPGRSYWPEPDTLRQITGKFDRHVPEHEAGNWFPRAAYGMPVQIEFKNAIADHDPQGKFMVKPSEKERWPSPVILKIVKTTENVPVLRCVIVLNAEIPPAIHVEEKDSGLSYPLGATEMPMATLGKSMPKMPQAFAADRNPYSALIRHLGLEEVL